MSPPLAVIAQGAFNSDHMGGGWGWLAIVAMAAMMGAMGWMMWSMMRLAGDNDRSPSEDPVDVVLKARYARGELTTEELRQRLRTIEGTRR